MCIPGSDTDGKTRSRQGEITRVVNNWLESLGAVESETVELKLGGADRFLADDWHSLKDQSTRQLRLFFDPPSHPNNLKKI